MRRDNDVIDNTSHMNSTFYDSYMDVYTNVYITCIDLHMYMYIHVHVGTKIMMYINYM